MEHQIPPTNVRSHALTYARRGWPVVPLHAVTGNACTCGKRDCRSAGKHPRTRHGAHDATRDEATIARLFHGDTNIGIATGATASGIAVLDVDPRNGGNESLAALERRLGTLLPTVTCATGGGGRHLYFVAPAVRLVGRLADGVDVKADGGLVVAPPSRHASGGSYAWERNRSPDEVKLGTLPPRWLAALTAAEPQAATVAPSPPPGSAWVTKTERVTRAIAYARALPPAVSGAGGHAATFMAASKLAKGFLLDEDEAFKILWDVWNPNCDPPWSRHDLRRKVQQARKSGRFPSGALLFPSTSRGAR